MQPKNTAYIFTLLSILFWGGAATAFKTALLQLTPLTLLWTSSLISLLLLTLLMMSTRKLRDLFQLSATHWLYLIALGGLNPFLYYVILFQAYDLLPGQVAMSLNYLWPVMLTVLSVPILKHTLNLSSFMSIVLSFAGAVIIASGGNFSAWGQLNTTGVLLALISTLVWAIYWLLSTRIPVDAIIKLFVGFISGSIFSIIYAISKNQLQVEISSFPWLPVAYVGIFEMGITFFIWLKALQLASNAAKVANLIYLTPFISLLVLAFFLKEAIYLSTIVGLLVIIMGILTQQYLTHSSKN